MSTAAYMTGRQRYQRPQAVLWSENSGTLVNGLYVPNGLEVGQYTGGTADSTQYNQFLILSDHNRSPLNFTPTRIETRERMINGRMRSYHTADKMTIAMSWDMLPSRAYNSNAEFNSTGKSPMDHSNEFEYTADGGAGGVELLDWYNNHTGSFWMFLAYDNYKNFKNATEPFGHINQYNELIEVFISDFQYSVVKRGTGTSSLGGIIGHDLWNVSVTLEEV